MNITFDQSDVEKMAASFKSRLSEAVKHFPDSRGGKISLEDVQRWAVQQDVDTPELLEATLKKNWDGSKSSGQPMSRM